MPKNYFEPHVRVVEDFPTPGIRFYDIAPLLGNGALFGSFVEEMAEPLRDKVTKVVGFDARGFIFGSAMAKELGAGFVMLRKPGKLPGETLSTGYDLEYGSNTLHLQSEALSPEDRVVLVDDVIATGGTAMAGVELVRQSGAELVEFCTALDLPHLGGSERLSQGGVAVRAMLTFGGQS